MQEVLDMQFKNSIVYGMPYELFWNGCPSIYYTYQEAYKEKLIQEDILNWQRSIYGRLATASVLSPKDCKYPESPIFYASQKENREKSVFDLKEKFISIMEKINENIKK